jgi:hypothetical protein
MAILFETNSIPMNRAALTVIVTTPSRKTTMRPARSRLREKVKLKTTGRGRTKTIEMSDEATNCRLAFILNTSETMFKDQLILAKGIAVNVVHSPSLIDLVIYISRIFM